MIASCSLIVLSLKVVQRWTRQFNSPPPGVLKSMSCSAPTILAVQAAIALVASAAQAHVLAPNIPMPAGPLRVFLVGLEMAIAFSLVTGIADWVGALALIALVPATAALGAPADPFEQLFWVGIGAVVLVIGRGASTCRRARPWFRSRIAACSERAMLAVRVTTGVSIIAVALTEKVWNPDLGRAFLAAYPSFNFVHTVFGISWFSDDLFVLLAGLTEAMIGAALISGQLTRLVVLGMWLPFNIGLLVLPSQELLGHLPLFGIMYFLLVSPRQREPVRIFRPAASGDQLVAHQVLVESAA
jgi:hypothetical protein